MASERAKHRLHLVEVNDEGVRAALVSIDEMSKDELRDLVRNEPQIFIDAVEGIIVRRQYGE